jgi:lysophospholipase L1-like esterase
VPVARELRTRRGTFSLSRFDLWRDRGTVAPVADVLRPGASVALVGSCFAAQAARYLERRGYQVWSHPAGELYVPEIIRIELEHVLAGTPWPDEIAVEQPDGWAHRFRKRCTAASEGELRRRDAEMTSEARAALEAADVVLVIAGTTTETWRDAGGVATNEIPHPALFDERDWTLDPGDREDIARDLQQIHALLREHTPAQPVYTVCPIPLNATWTAAPIVAANGRAKSLLRVALDELPDDAVYLDLWDWVQAQTGRWTPMQRDGRHLSEAGVAAVMRFAERRLGAVAPRPGARERATVRLADARTRLAALRGRRPRSQAPTPD